MAEITASLVKELRAKTGAGMMDCKSALVEVDGDVEAAVDWLRKKGLSSAAKKAGRTASEGLVGVAISGGTGVLVEINSETDFVARNEQFQGLVRQITDLALDGPADADALSAAPYPGQDRTVAEEISHLVATIGEKLTLRRAAGISTSPGVVAAYTHNAAAPGLGKIGVLVALKTEAKADQIENLGKQLAMHIAAANPKAVNVEDLELGLVERERQVLADQARESGKPEEIIEKMVEGRLRKFYEESVLLSQTWVIDGETKVASVLEAAAAEAGCSVEVGGFLRYVLGEGIEKAETDFAAEVAEAAGNN